MTQDNTAIQVHDQTAITEDQMKTSQVTYRPAMDLFEGDDHFTIQVALPGAVTDDIDVVVNESVLTVEARVQDRHAEHAEAVFREYGVGDFRRQIRLGEDVDPDGLTANYADGVLTLTLPKQARRQARRITITSD